MFTVKQKTNLYSSKYNTISLLKLTTYFIMIIIIIIYKWHKYNMLQKYIMNYVVINYISLLIYININNNNYNNNLIKMRYRVKKKKQNKIYHTYTLFTIQ